MKKPIVIYHSKCADGFSAAWCFWNKYGDEYEYYPGVYGNPPPDVSGRDVFLVDFSYKRNVVEQMIKVAKNVVLIDHHKTAIDDLANLEGLIQYVDLNRSGATLAWDFLNPLESRPPLLGHIEDRDLWKFKLPNTREIQSYVFSHEYTFESWDKLMSADQVELMKMTAAGSAIERKHQKDVAELVNVCKRRMTIGGYDVPVACLPYTMVSDAGNIMAQNELFSACYWDTKDARIFGLRSTESGIDVSEIALKYGGGGHKNAAGFQVQRTHELAKA